MKKEELPNVSIVVIGMNEEKNLDTTFSAINNIDYPKEKIELIYVDTDSSDNSVDIAMRYTNKVFIEQSNWPTPGLARNKGLIEASHDIVHFVDGDIQIDAKYLKMAVKKLKEPTIHAVYGFLEEKSVKGINRILLSHWNQKQTGLSDATGGGGTYKKETLLKVNGYDERIRKGQEIELGIRFREAGNHIWFMNTKMGIHNYGVVSIGDYLGRQIDYGKSTAFNMLLGRSNSFFNGNWRRSLNNVIFNLCLFSFLALTLISKKIVLLPPGLLTMFIVYPLIKYYVIKRTRDREQLIFLLLMNFSRPFFFWGQLKIFFKFFFQDFLKKKIIIKDKMILDGNWTVK